MAYADTPMAAKRPPKPPVILNPPQEDVWVPTPDDELDIRQATSTRKGPKTFQVASFGEGADDSVVYLEGGEEEGEQGPAYHIAYPRSSLPEGTKKGDYILFTPGGAVVNKGQKSGQFMPPRVLAARWAAPMMAAPGHVHTERCVDLTVGMFREGDQAEYFRKSSKAPGRTPIERFTDANRARDHELKHQQIEVEFGSLGCTMPSDIVGMPYGAAPAGTVAVTGQSLKFRPPAPVQRAEKLSRIYRKVDDAINARSAKFDLLP